LKRNTMLVGLGLGPEEGSDDEMDAELEDLDEDEGAMAAEDEMIDLAMDPEADPDDRREAFRSAVRACLRDY
jgi:hypothetical protein